MVACVDGKLLSVYDGTYEYSLHKWNLCKAGANAHPPLWTALWVYPTLQQASASPLSVRCSLHNAKAYKDVHGQHSATNFANACNRSITGLAVALILQQSL